MPGPDCDEIHSFKIACGDHPSTVGKAFCADPVKIRLAGLDPAGKITVCSLNDRINIRQVDIIYPVAVIADKVLMLCDYCVIVLCAASGRYLRDLPDLGQKGKIAVHSAETDVRIFLAQRSIDRVCSRMIRAALQKMFDSFALSAVF